MTPPPAAHALAPPARLAELAARALLGTDRAGGSDDAPALLLREAAILGAKTRAGRTIHADGSPLPACEVADRTPAPPATAHTLRRLIDLRDVPLAVEWCELASARNLRIPDSLLPEILDWWTMMPGRPAAVYAAAGRRGQWLASLNLAWRKPVVTEEVPADADNIWQTGASADRLALLRTMRRSELERPRRMIESTWSTDTAADRAKFVAALAEGLSMADEAFLESALDDRSKQVREAAAALLAKLPDSRLAARMLERAVPMFTVRSVKKGLLRSARPVVEVEPPAAFDPAWARDGIEEKASGRGQRAWWMTQILAATPLDALTARLGLSAAELVEGVSESPFAPNLMSAWSERAPAEGNAGWCDAILSAHLAKEQLNTEAIVPLVAKVDPALAEPMLESTLAHKSMDWRSTWRLLAEARHPWSSPFSTRVITHVRRVSPSKRDDDYPIYEHMAAVFRTVHPSCIKSLAEAVLAAFKADPPPGIQKQLDRARLRADMHKEFAP